MLAELPAPDDLAAALRDLTVPTLILVGDQDSDSLAPSRRLFELLPKAELTVIEDAGHVVNLAKPAEYNARVQAFLSSLPVCRAQKPPAPEAAANTNE